MMTTIPPLRIGEVAELTGLSIRTLHYYDAIGLLEPIRTESGYRMYTEENLFRLQQVMIGRSLGLSLEEIRQSLDDPGFDYGESLKRQRQRLQQKLTETHRMIAAIDIALEHLNSPKERPMTPEQIFDGFDPAAHEEEAKAKWGETDAYRESRQRTKSYTQADWQEIKAEADAIWRGGAAAMAAGEAPDSEEARALVSRHRDHIERWFYQVPPELHLGLADMWEADDRFRHSIDSHGKGLTGWFASAIRKAYD